MIVCFYFIQECIIFANCYYLATELHEYTLTEYIGQLGDKDNIKKARLVFQFLRGLSMLHQQFLVIHGELRVSICLESVVNYSVTQEIQTVSTNYSSKAPGTRESVFTMFHFILIQHLAPPPTHTHTHTHPFIIVLFIFSSSLFCYVEP